MNEPYINHHPVDDMEPEAESTRHADATNQFRRIFAWIFSGGAARNVSMRTHIVALVLFQDLCEQTCQSIGDRHGVTRAAVSKIAVEFCEAFKLTTTLKNRAMRSSRTKQKCKITQSRIRRRPQSPKSSKRMSRLRSLQIKHCAPQLMPPAPPTSAANT